MLLRVERLLDQAELSRRAAEIESALGCAVAVHQTASASGWRLVDSPDSERVARAMAAAGVELVAWPANRPYVLASRDFQRQNTVVTIGPVQFGGAAIPLIAGPCSVESEESLRRTAASVRESGATCLRAGAFKPRTSPYAFQGLGEKGLEILRRVADEFDLAVVTEVMAPEDVNTVAAYADVLQIGSRNAQNFPLLRAVGRASRPVLLKRGMMARIDELLGAADYVLAEGNSAVILCERGIRGFDPATRNVFDVSAVPLLKQLSHLPVIVDPSHACGRSDLVPSAALAAIAAGADGLMVEVHCDPECSISDPDQALGLSAWHDLIQRLDAVAHAVDRRLARRRF